MEDELLDFSKDPLEGQQIWSDPMDLGLKFESPLIKSINPSVSPLEEETIAILGELERQQFSEWISNSQGPCTMTSENLLSFQVDLQSDHGR